MDQLRIFNFSSGFNFSWYWYFYAQIYPLLLADR
jgi:hypothetical protein